MKLLRPVICLLAMFVMVATTAFAGTVVNQNSCRRYHDLQCAICDACDGDTLRLCGKFCGNFNNDCKSITLRGGSNVILDGGGCGSVFTVCGSCTTVVFKNIIIRNGCSTCAGGGIDNTQNSILEGTDGENVGSPCTNTVKLFCSQVVCNSAQFGGGIANTGKLYMRGSKVKNNYAYCSGGGIFTNCCLHIDAPDADAQYNGCGYGGQIVEHEGGDVDVADAGDTDADADTDADTEDPEGSKGSPGTIYVRNSDISCNAACSCGGGIFVGHCGTTYISCSHLKKNRAGSDGGGVANHGCFKAYNLRVCGNCAECLGGGFFNCGFLKLKKSDITRNKADCGGGIFNHCNGILCIEDTDVEQNCPNDVISGCIPPQPN